MKIKPGQKVEVEDDFGVIHSFGVVADYDKDIGITIVDSKNSEEGLARLNRKGIKGGDNLSEEEFYYYEKKLKKGEPLKISDIVGIIAKHNTESTSGSPISWARSRNFNKYLLRSIIAGLNILTTATTLLEDEKSILLECKKQLELVDSNWGGNNVISKALYRSSINP